MKKITYFTYLLKVTSVCIAVVAIYNTKIDYIPAYIFTTVFSVGIAVILWLVADIADEVNSQKTPSHTNESTTDDTTERLQKGA